MNSFRKLKADEIEIRPGRVKKDKNGDVTGYSLLLYKDARVDQKLLDETVGPLNWQKHYSRDNANCTVAIWDDEKKQWIEKEDTGTESNTEEEKGLASDSFKRACFCWGIGRELYTAPFIWINGSDTDAKYRVTNIGYDDAGNICTLTIINSKSKEVAWTTEKAITSKPQKKNENYKSDKKVNDAKNEEDAKQDAAVEEAALKAKVIGYVNRNKFKQSDIDALCKRYKVSSLNELNADACKHYISFVESHGGKIDE